MSTTPPGEQPPYGPYVPPSGQDPYGPPPATGRPYGPPPGGPVQTGSVQPGGPVQSGGSVQPGQGHGSQDDRPLDVVSVVGLVLGITFLLAPVGLVLGVVGLFRTAGGQRRGRGLAIAAVVVSVVMSVLLGLLVAAVVALGAFVSTTVGELDETQLEQFQEDLEELQEPGGLEDPEGLRGLGARTGGLA